jgi:hypothetical protein
MYKYDEKMRVVRHGLGCHQLNEGEDGIKVSLALKRAVPGELDSKDLSDVAVVGEFEATTT